ncbi:MFS transporter [Stakelama sp. CBK3Z-3]|uniref:MFS transporter n=1 Tax=Stakelama flava TaxID=2860338 RepID=A0ABS6XKQ1_9SPHN|nr:MFS transporter [Stakelama flava]MBW4330785.1 MFS transporter [Stakelama flava]
MQGPAVIGNVALKRPATGWALPVRLSAMMLLELMVFGAWLPTLGLVLASHGAASIIGNAYLLSAVAAIVSPLFMGAVGDRFIAPRNLLAILHVAGAVVIASVPTVLAAGNLYLTLALLFVYMALFQPTLGLANSIALTLLGENARLFPYVRVFGTIGWVTAGLGVGTLGFSASAGVFYFAAGAGVLLAVYALTIPYTPPPSAGAKLALGDAIGIDALVLFRDRRFAVLMICILMTAISLGFYNAYASPYLAALGIENVAGLLAIGQISEVIFIITIPFALSRIGMKWALALGMATWSVRFLLFILAGKGVLGAAIAGVALHGICADYFIVVGAMYIARLAPAHLASQAQSWLILMISGFGGAIGSVASGALYAAKVAPAEAIGGPSAWAPLWSFPVGLAILTTLVWIFLFPRNMPEQEPVEQTQTQG